MNSVVIHIFQSFSNDSDSNCTLVYCVVCFCPTVYKGKYNWQQGFVLLLVASKSLKKESQYAERLEFFFEANEIKEDPKKRPVFLTVIGVLRRTNSCEPLFLQRSLMKQNMLILWRPWRTITNQLRQKSFKDLNLTVIPVDQVNELRSTTKRWVLL